MVDEGVVEGSDEIVATQTPLARPINAREELELCDGKVRIVDAPIQHRVAKLSILLSIDDRHSHKVAEDVEGVCLCGDSSSDKEMMGDGVEERGVFCEEPFVPFTFGATGEDFDRRVGGTHSAGKLPEAVSVTRRSSPAHLPSTVKFVSDLPVAHIVGFEVPVLCAVCSFGGVGRTVAIFDPAPCLFWRACAGVDANDWLTSDRSTEGDKLIRTEKVRLYITPGEIRAGRALFPVPLPHPPSGKRLQSCLPASGGF